MAKHKRYSSVTDLAHDILGDEDPSFVEELKNQMQSRILVRMLARMRSQNGVTQQDVAEVLGCNQSKISKIENGIDGSVSMEEIEAYAKASNCEVVVQFVERNETAFERIKRYAFEIHDELCGLANLAQGDEEIAKGVAKTFGEVMFNQLRLLQLAAKQLPRNPETNEPYISVQLGMGTSKKDIPAPSNEFATDCERGVSPHSPVITE